MKQNLQIFHNQLINLNTLRHFAKPNKFKTKRVKDAEEILPKVKSKKEKKVIKMNL